MIKIIIFGTGSTGQRAWHAATGVDGIVVEAFADNDARKHGTFVNGKPIVAPADLLKMSWDYVVLASQWASDIAKQLTGLGIAAEKLRQPALNAIRADLQQIVVEAEAICTVRASGGRSIQGDQLPRVLILTYETLNDSHGTGVMLLRYFRNFPRARLFSLCHLEAGKPVLENAAVLDTPQQQTASRVASILRARNFAPDLVYATAFNENDLPLLKAVLDALPAGTPVIQHFMDYMPHDPEVFDHLFRALLPRVTQTWALTESLRDFLANRFAHPVTHVSCLHQSLPTEWRQDHLEFRPGFRTVLLGNPWQPWIIPFLADVWRRCREALPGLLPIEWYCHPMRVQAAIEAGYDPGFEIVWRGFIPGLQERLRTADLAVLAFNMEREVSNLYARGSVPSRITELAAAGLPVFAIASGDSGLAQMIDSRGIGCACAGPESEPVALALVSFIRDRQARAAAGHAARTLAATEFLLEPFQEWLVGQFLDLTAGRDRATLAAEPSSLVPLARFENSAPTDWRELVHDRINYACGRNVVDGWLNVDGFDESYPYGTVPADYVKRIFRMDLTRAHPFPDESFRLAYSEDFLEHLDQADSITFLAEAFRTLKKGGVLRLSFPGLPGILRRHFRGSGFEAGAQCREEAYTRWWHKHFFSFEELAEVTRAIGYSEIRRCEYGKGTIPELLLDTRQDQADLNLVVELVK